MGKVFAEILPEHREFIEKQHMFFVGTAPLNGDGHVNISPKGYDAFRIISSTEVAYLDLTGSGNETSAHVEENGRITLMFISFEGQPLILRLYGTANVILPETDRWNMLIDHFNPLPGARQIIYTQIHAVKTSCGFSIPYYSYSGERDMLYNFAIKKGEEGLKVYQQEKNSVSMDGALTPLGKAVNKK